jgi:hypothetical protein
VKSEVITAINMKIFVLWGVISCGLVCMNRIHGVISLTAPIGVHVLFSVMQGLISVSTFHCFEPARKGCK